MPINLTPINVRATLTAPTMVSAQSAQYALTLLDSPMPGQVNQASGLSSMPFWLELCALFEGLKIETEAEAEDFLNSEKFKVSLNAESQRRDLTCDEYEARNTLAIFISNMDKQASSKRSLFEAMKLLILAFTKKNYINPETLRKIGGPFVWKGSTHVSSAPFCEPKAYFIWKNMPAFFAQAHEIDIASIEQIPVDIFENGAGLIRYLKNSTQINTLKTSAKDNAKAVELVLKSGLGNVINEHASAAASPHPIQWAFEQWASETGEERDWTRIKNLVDGGITISTRNRENQKISILLHKIIKKKATDRTAPAIDIDKIKILIKAGLDLNWQNTENGNTLLHLVAQQGHFSVVNFLLNTGVNPLLKNQKNKTARDILEKMSASDIFASWHGGISTSANNGPTSASTENFLEKINQKRIELVNRLTQFEGNALRHHLNSLVIA